MSPVSSPILLHKSFATIVPALMGTVVGLGAGNSVTAQVVADDTFATTDVNLNGQVFEVNGGTQPSGGVNLFHSFAQFSVPSGMAVKFNSAIDIENIIARVTGANASFIDGPIFAQGDVADLFLLNPNGIIFGPNAELDIGGSFVASTAEQIVFANGARFSATYPRDPSLLTLSEPVGVQYGANPPRITNRAMLQVNPGQTVSLLDGANRGGNQFQLNAAPTNPGTNPPLFSFNPPARQFLQPPFAPGGPALPPGPGNTEAGVTYQAETANTAGNVRVENEDLGAFGGNVDLRGATGASVEWVIQVPNDGDYVLSWRYALGNDPNRPLELNVNGAVVEPQLGFPNTSGWNRWEIVNQSVSLIAGVNRISLTTIGFAGADIDYLQVARIPNPRIGLEPPGRTPPNRIPPTLSSEKSRLLQDFPRQKWGQPKEQMIEVGPDDFADRDPQTQPACSRREGEQFVITGRGGVPQDASQPLRSQAVWQDLRLGEVTPLHPDQSQAEGIDQSQVSAAVKQMLQKPLVEAERLVIGTDGRIYLVTEQDFGSGDWLPWQCGHHNRSDQSNLF